jgi:Protein of unknown function (DUF3040)
MALSMDEQRVLAEIERRLSADDPGLASCLTTFRRPGPGTILRSPRARVIGSLFTVLVVAMVSLMVYAMIPFRAHMVNNKLPSDTAPAGGAAISATGTRDPGTGTATISASNTIRPSTRVSSTSQSAPSGSASASGKSEAAPRATSTNGTESPLTSP